MERGLWVLQTPATTELFGEATTAPGAEAATIHTRGAAYLGNAGFGMELDGAPANAPAFLVIGAAKASARLRGLNINVNLGAPFVVLPATTNAHGAAALKVPLTAITTTGRVLAQWFIAAPQASGFGLAATRGMSIDLFQL